LKWLTGFQRRRNQKYMEELGNMSDTERFQLDRLREQHSPARSVGRRVH
jgi:hypothetical protein